MGSDSLKARKDLLRWARRRANDNNLPFNLELDDIHIPVQCPILGVDLVAGPEGRRESSPTLDKVVPELGYVKGNILVISKRANRLKSDAELWEMAAMLDYYNNHIKREWMR